MTRKAVTVPGAVTELPYSPAVESNGMLFMSGQIGIDSRTNKIVEGGITAQTHQVMNNIKDLLAAANLTLDDVVKCTAFITDMTEFAQFNEVYASCFSQPFPARSTIGVAALPGGARVEVEVIAQLK